MQLALAALLVAGITAGAEVRAIRDEAPTLLGRCSSIAPDGAEQRLGFWVEENILESQGRWSERTLTFSAELATRDDSPFGSGIRVWESVRPNPPGIAPLYNWAGELVCDDSGAFVFVLRFWINTIDLSVYRLEPTKLKPIERARVRTKADRDREVRRPTPSLVHFEDYAANQRGNLWGFAVEPEGDGFIVRLIYEEEEDHRFDLRLKPNSRELERITPTRQDYARLLQSEVLGETRCLGEDGFEKRLTLRRRDYLSPPQLRSVEAGPMLTLEVEGGKLQHGVAWGDFDRVAPTEVAKTRWRAILNCEPAKNRLHIVLLQATPSHYEIGLYFLRLPLRLHTDIPPEDSLPWKWLVNFHSNNLLGGIRETKPELVASIRDIRLTIRDGEQFLELIHDPPEAHEYDLDCSNPAWAIKKVPVAKKED